jgi:hypothetical protein
MLKHFYTTIIGLDILGSFENHDGYDGIFIGLKNKDWHLEFTQSEEKVNHKPDEDDLIILYPDIENFKRIKETILKNNTPVLKAKNPYWNTNGITIYDPDKYRVVIAKPNQ